MAIVSSVRDFGILLDADFSMRTHVAKTVASCFTDLRQIRITRRSVCPSLLRSLISSLAFSRLDYRCATLAGLPRQLLNKLQSVFNAAAPLIFASRRHDHVTSLLRSLHWLRAPKRITFRSAVLALLTGAFTARHPYTSLLSCFRSEEPVDISGYDVRQR